MVKYSLNTHIHALGRGHASDAHEHVVGELGDLAGTALAAMELLGAHGLQHRQGALEILFAAARHEREGCVLGSHGT